MALIICPECGKEVSDRAEACPHCGYPINEMVNKENYDNGQKNDVSKNMNDGFDGIYRIVGWGKQEKIFCPMCKSSNCSWYTQDRIIPGKTKTKYTVNLNPLKPFTIVNKKEKVIRQEKVKEIKKIMCNNCGYTFF